MELLSKNRDIEDKINYDAFIQRHLCIDGKYPNYFELQNTLEQIVKSTNNIKHINGTTNAKHLLLSQAKLGQTTGRSPVIKTEVETTNKQQNIIKHDKLKEKLIQKQQGEAQLLRLKSKQQLHKSFIKSISTIIKTDKKE